jgi:hypothetical protein
MDQIEMSGPKPEDENDTGEDEPEDEPAEQEEEEPLQVKNACRNGPQWVRSTSGDGM